MTQAPPPAIDPILLVHERYQQAGGEDGVFEAQLDLLRARGHTVEPLEVDNDDIHGRDGLRDRVGLALGTVWSPDGQRRVRAAIDRVRPAILHAHNTFPLLSPAIHAAAHGRGVVTVQTLHNYRLICPSATLFRDGRPCHDCVGKPIAWPGVVHACYRESPAASGVVAAMDLVHRARRTWAHDVDQVVVLARFAAGLLRHGGIPTARMSVLPNFVADPGPTSPAIGSGYLFVGRLTEDKGVLTAIEAWRQLPAEVTLTIAGSGPAEAAVRAAAQADPRIRYVGRLDSAGVDQALAQARALLVPSHWYENCPLTVLEAFAAGRPVIASDHGGLAELVDDGVSGLLVRPADPTALAEAVRRFEADPAVAADSGRAARAVYEDRFTPDRAYDGLVATYRRALAVHAQHP